MTRRNMPTTDQIVEAFTKHKTLRGAGNALGVSHNMVKAHLEKAGITPPTKAKQEDALNYGFRVYLRPSQIEELEKLAIKETEQRKKSISVHEMARIVVDEMLSKMVPDYQPTDQPQLAIDQR